MPKRKRPSSISGDGHAVEDELAKARELGGFEAVTGSHFPRSAKVLVDNGWNNLVAAAEVVTTIRDHLTAVFDRIERESANEAEMTADLLGARSLQQLMYAPRPLKRKVTRTRKGIADSFGVPESTLRSYENIVLRRAAREFVNAAASLTPTRTITRAANGLLAASPFAKAEGDARSVQVAELLGRSDVEIVDALYRGARLGEGFVAQEYGFDGISRASSGMVVYALGRIGWITDAVIAPLHDELIGWINPDGTLGGPNAKLDPPNTFAESCVLLALTGRANVLNGSPLPYRLARRLLQEQQAGGWKYRDSSHGARSIWTLYPILALRRSTQLGWIDDESLTRTCASAKAFLDADLERRIDRAPLESVVTLRAIQLTQKGEKRPLDARYVQHLQSLTARITQRGWLENALETIRDDHQAHGVHVTLSVPALYLAARNIWPKDHPVNLLIGAELRRTFDRTEAGWTNSDDDNARPYSWATAWGVVAARALAGDIDSTFGSIGTWERRVRLASGRGRRPKPPNDQTAAESQVFGGMPLPVAAAD